MSLECVFEQRFDNSQKLQYVNNEPSVIHCHHYSTLFTKLAIDMEDFGGKVFLKEAAEESIFIVLKKYFITYKINSEHDKINICEKYCALCGLGKLELEVAYDGGRAKMIHSHVDEGWKAKWGSHTQSVNFIGQGYILASFNVIKGTRIGFFDIEETKSIVKGDAYSEFMIKKGK